MSWYILEQFVNGLILGSMYALVAIGFTMIYGILRLINFAHGDIVMIGAFVTLGLVIIGAPLPVIIVLVLGAGGFMGFIVERVAFRPMRGAPQVTGFIASLAISILLQNAGILIFTAQPRNFFFPEYLLSIIKAGPLSIRTLDISIIGISIVLMVLLVVVVKTTKVGMAMRATAENLNTARLMGININRIIMLTFMFGSSLAGIAGMMWGGKYGQIDPLIGFVPGLKAFVAAVIGGIGSITGAMAGGYILGLAEILFVGLLPPIYSAYRDAFVFGTLILILFVKPSGLMGKGEEEKA
ncbi:High-affinity branched-chain amino acid transport system permease protein LivH [subsurface metagenome]